MNDPRTRRAVSFPRRVDLRVREVRRLPTDVRFSWQDKRDVGLETRDHLEHELVGIGTGHDPGHVGARHLDVGVGTGWFLDHCRWPVESPKITLLDLNENSLAVASKRIRRHAPATMQAFAWGQ